MAKFFVSRDQIENDKVIIKGEDVKHILNVLRLDKQDNIYVCSKGEETTYETEILEIKKDEVICKILKELEGTTEPYTRIHIFQGIPKSEKMEWIIQKGTEIGVKDFTPVAMDRCVSRIDKKDENKKIGRWQKIAEAAAKQSGRDHIPKIHSICNIDDLSDKIKKMEKIILAYEKEEKITLKQEIKTWKKSKIRDIAIIIGPEGGITEAEAEKIKNMGAISITLGKRILRTETVALVVASIIMYEQED